MGWGQEQVKGKTPFRDTAITITISGSSSSGGNDGW